MKGGIRHTVRVLHLGHCLVTTKLDNLQGITDAEIKAVLAGHHVKLADGRIVTVVREPAK